MKWETAKKWDGHRWRRVDTTFLLIPRECEDGQTRWLERVKRVSEFYSDWGGGSWHHWYYPLDSEGEVE